MKYLSTILFTFYCLTLPAQQSEWQDYLEKKQFDKIIRDAGDLQPTDSTDISKMYLIGQAYEGLLKYKDAYGFYKHCYSLDSFRIDMLNTLARMAVNIGRTNEAEAYYHKVLEVDSDNFFANYQLARLYASLENYGKALYHYALLSESDSTNAVLLRGMGDCFTRLNEFEAALSYYQDAFHANVENASLASVLINTLLKLNHPMHNDYASEALQICDTALYYNQGNITLRQNKAMIYFVKDEYRKADTIYTSLLAEKDSSYNTLKYCGSARYYSQHWFEAIEPLEKAYPMDTTAVDVCLLLGHSLGKTYDSVLAMQYFDKAEKLMEPHPVFVERLTQFRAEVYVQRGDCNRGAALYYQLWQKNEEKISFLQLIQRCYAFKSFNSMSDDERQRYLFISFLLASEALKKPKTSEMSDVLSYLHSVLKKFEEEMFFRSVTSLPMLSPDNKRNSLSLEKLKELNGKLSNN
jgi:tetratricopeptide (TPR) repeat protein